MTPRRPWRASAEILLFAVAMFLMAAGLAGGVLLLALWRTHVQAGTIRPGGAMTTAPIGWADTLWPWTLAAPGTLGLGLGLLALYLHWQRPPASRRQGSDPEPAVTPGIAGTWVADLLGVGRWLLGAVLVLGAGFAWCLALPGALLMAGALTSPGERLRIGGEGTLPGPFGLLGLGLVLGWAAYLCFFTRADLEHVLAEERRRHALTTAEGLAALSRRRSATPQGVPSPPGGIVWRGVLVRGGLLWAAAWTAGHLRGAWALDARGLAMAAGVAVVFWLGTGVFLLVHELGHGLGAWAAGVRCTALRVGRGPLLLRLPLGATTMLTWHAWPADGSAHVAFEREDHFRGRYALVFAGGPLAQALGMALLLWTAAHLRPPFATLATALVVVDGVWLIAGSLLPLHRGSRGGDETEPLFSDAAALLNAARLPAVHVRWRVALALVGKLTAGVFSPDPEERRVAAGPLAALRERFPEQTTVRVVGAFAARQRGAWAEAAGELGALLAPRAPGEDTVPGTLRGWARTERLIALAMAGDFARARTECLESLRGDRHEPVEAKVERLDRLACLPLMDGLETYREEAMDWIERALALDPDNLSLHGTRASLLVEAGRTEEGRALLERVRAGSRSENDQGICAFYLAVVARRQGRPNEAEDLLAEAKRRCPSHAWMVPRWERESQPGEVP